jgi:pimeloyl-ACP methyl ester carboxylesterase
VNGAVAALASFIALEMCNQTFGSVSLNVMLHDFSVKSDVSIYLLTGMTPDDRIFDRLVPLLPNCHVVKWLEPRPSESIVHYSHRLAETIPTSNCFIGGVSFGGIVALELSRVVQPRGCFLISSIRNPEQLPPWLRMWRLIAFHHCQRMLDAIGRLSTIVPRRRRTRSTARLTKLAGKSGAWHRWATAAVLRWKPDHVMPPIRICHIHGDRDTTFPIRYVDPDVVVRDGGHVLPLTHPGDVANAVLAMIADAA